MELVKISVQLSNLKNRVIFAQMNKWVVWSIPIIQIAHLNSSIILVRIVWIILVKQVLMRFAINKISL